MATASYTTTGDVTFALLSRVAAVDQVTAERLAQGERFETVPWLDRALPPELQSRYKSLTRSSSFTLPKGWSDAKLAGIAAKLDEIESLPLVAVSPPRPGRPRIPRPVLDALSAEHARLRILSGALRKGELPPPRGAMPVGSWRRLSYNGLLWPTVDDRGEITLAQVIDEEDAFSARPWFEATVTEHVAGMPVLVIVGRSDTRWVRNAVRCALANAAADPLRRRLYIYIASPPPGEARPVTKTLVWDIVRKENTEVQTTVQADLESLQEGEHVLVLDADEYDSHHIYRLSCASTLIVAGKAQFRNKPVEYLWRSSLLRELAAFGHPVLADDVRTPMPAARSAPPALIEEPLAERPRPATDISTPRPSQWDRLT